MSNLEIFGTLPLLIIKLFLLVLIMRFLCELLRVNFYNPLIQAMVRITNPALRFMQRFIPQVYGINLAAVVLIILLGMVEWALPLLLAGHQFQWGGVLIISLVDSLNTATWIFLVAILGTVVLSWVAPQSQHHAVSLIYSLSQPITAPFRRFLPPLGGLDFSPMAALLLLRFIQQSVLLPLMNYGFLLLY